MKKNNKTINKNTINVQKQTIQKDYSDGHTNNMINKRDNNKSLLDGNIQAINYMKSLASYCTSCIRTSAQIHNTASKMSLFYVGMFGSISKQMFQVLNRIVR